MTMKYFAYGSNLNQDHWNSWCREHGFDGSGLRPLAEVTAAVLPDYELSFSRRSQRWNGGALNLVPSPGNAVEGVLFEFTDLRIRDALDRKEGVKCGAYERREVTVLDDWGGATPAFTYICPTASPAPYFEPSDNYVKTVRQGLEEFDLDTAALDLAAAGKPAKLFENALFCCGDLMRGENGFGVLRSHGVSCALLADVRGRLVDLGENAAMIGCLDGETEVHGDFFRVNNFRAAVQQLDRRFCFVGYGAPNSLFERRLTEVHVGDGRVRRAWTYIYMASDGDIVPSGCWRTRRSMHGDVIGRIVDEHLGESPEAVFREIRRQHPWRRSAADMADLPRTKRQLRHFLATGRFSERKLAQASNIWTAFCSDSLHERGECR